MIYQKLCEFCSKEVQTLYSSPSRSEEPGPVADAPPLCAQSSMAVGSTLLHRHVGFGICFEKPLPERLSTLKQTLVSKVEEAVEPSLS